MKVKSLTINNFRGISNLQIEKLDPHVNIVVGINGAGKTTLLESVAIMLSWLLARLRSQNAKGVYPSDKDIKLNAKEGCSLDMTIQDGHRWVINKKKSNYRRKNDSTVKADFSMLTELADSIIASADRGEGVPVLVYYPVDRAIASVPVNLHRNKPESSIWDVYKNALSGTSDFRTLFEWYRKQEDIENELIRDNPQYRDKCLQAIRNAISYFFPDFSEMRVRRSPYQAMVVSKGEEVMEFTQLSQGEKCYLSLVCDIARRLAMANPHLDNPLDGEGVIIIDEVDLHLHPKWQTEIVSNLVHIFHNCQFILSTHSAQVLSDVQRQQIIPLVNGQKVDIALNPYGKLTSSITASYFGNYQQRNREVAAMIDNAFEALKSGDKERYKSTFNTLASILDPTDRDMINLIIEAKRRELL